MIKTRRRDISDHANSVRAIETVNNTCSFNHITQNNNRVKNCFVAFLKLIDELLALPGGQSLTPFHHLHGTNNVSVKMPVHTSQ